MTRPRSLPEALGEYCSENTARFHMPGHKGRAMDGFFRNAGQGWDVTEIEGTDNLHSPHGAILDAERRMAEAMGARDTLLLVNGATAGIHAMCAYIAGGRLLLARDAHRSALSGCALFGVDALPLFPEMTVTAKEVAAALDREPCDAVLVTSPDYFGFCADLPAIAEAAHSRGALLFVDAAHGAHFPFSDALPASPAGAADAWVVSLHKTMNALTQTASLNIAALDTARFRRALALIETSSPSYLLMASADWARHTARGAWDAHVERALALRSRISSLYGLSLPDRAAALERGALDLDPTRVCIDVTGRGLTGFAAAAYMRPAGIVPEMADERRVVLITTPSDSDEWYTRLLSALDALPYGDYVPPPEFRPAASERVTDVRTALLSDAEPVLLRDAAGRVAGDAAGVYPPGTALIFPGERIAKAAVDELMRQCSLGGEPFGVPNGMVSCLRM